MKFERIYADKVPEPAPGLDARKKFFTGDFPTSTPVAVDALIDPRILVEIEAIAILGAGHD